MPASAILLSLLALAPFVGCGLGALGNDAGMAARMLTGLLAWGAVVLAFIGGMHWGLVMQASPVPAAGMSAAMGGPVAGGPALGVPIPERQRHARIGLGALPLILGWVALMLPLVTAYWVGLLLLIVAYIAALVAEHRFAAHLLLPRRYLPIRWGFTIVAVAMLTTVLTLRLLGQTIVL